MIDLSKNQKRVFSDEVLKQMMVNKNIVVVSGDMGYKMWDEVRRVFSKRFINTGAAEQVMIGIAVGLAISGKIPIVFSITPFLLYRPFETIRNYIDREKIPVKLIGGGRDKDYLEEGFSHWSCEDKKLMRIFKNIKSFWPKSYKEIPGLVAEMVKDPSPWYVNLRRR